MSANQGSKQSFWTTLPGILTGCAGVIGAVAALIGACYTAGLLSGFNPTATPSGQTVTVITQIVQPLPVSTDIVLPSPVPAAVTPNLLIPPQESQCPYDARASWLPYRDTWYGPWDGFWLRYDVNYFYVYDPNQWDAAKAAYGLETGYSTQMTRNGWIELLQSPFWVCIHIPGNVYVVYVP